MEVRDAAVTHVRREMKGRPGRGTEGTRILLWAECGVIVLGKGEGSDCVCGMEG